jgi:hypothetical protein
MACMDLIEFKQGTNEAQTKTNMARMVAIESEQGPIGLDQSSSCSNESEQGLIMHVPLFKISD